MAVAQHITLAVTIDTRAVVLLAEIHQLADSLSEDLSWRDEPKEIMEKIEKIARKYIKSG